MTIPSRNYPTGTETSYLPFCLVAIAVHLVVLFGIKPPTPQSAPVKDADKYMEVTLTVLPPEPKPIPPLPTPLPPPPEPPTIPPPPPPEPIPPPPTPPPPELISPPEPSPTTLPVLEKSPPTPEAPSAPSPVAPAVENLNPAPAIMPVTKTASPLPAPGQYLSVTQPSYASKVEPDYPTSARRLHQQGTVVLGLYINALGTLDKIEVIKSSGYPLLDQAAMDAMKQSGFHPAYQDNTPVPSHAEVSVTFQLQ